jgi:hypothetical protein
MRAAIALTTLASAVAVSLWACGGDDSSINPLSDGGGNDGNVNADGNGGQDTSTSPDTSTPCVGTDLRCKKVSCGGSVTTNLSGTVYDPAGKRTLYNVIVYIPNKTPDPITNGGPTCDHCGTVSGDPIVAAVTDANGNFTLKDVPAGASIPLVIQTGKWRRQVTISTVTACADNTADKSLTRLPSKASEGDIPMIAVASSSDPIECTLRKFGIDTTEFSAASGTGHVRVYQQNNGGMQKVNTVTTTAASTLWVTSELAKYDMLVNACECATVTNKGAAYAAVQGFMDSGGRVLGSHRAYDFFAPPRGPAEFQATADWVTPPNVNSPDYLDQSFPKGKAFSDWLVGNLGGTPGQMNLTTTGVPADVGAVKLATSRHMFESNSPPDAGAAASTKYLSFNTPTEVDGGTTALPPAQQCGRGGFADFHALGCGGGFGGPTSFPDTCNGLPTSMTDEEYAFEFIFFELGTCIQDETVAPSPPSATP